jgi:primosomal protein N' (replication factor Y)
VGVTQAGERYAQVLLDLPVGEVFDYRLDADQAALAMPGAWVVVPWGPTRRVGLVAAVVPESGLSAERVRDVLQVLVDAPVLPAAWFAFLRFVAGYYHRTLGEVALPALPKLLRSPPAPRARESVFVRLRRRHDRDAAPAPAEAREHPAVAPRLNAAQQAALEGIAGTRGFEVALLHGVTGSGKTEVYLHWLEAVLRARPDAQALLLVPEIGLTPQLVAQLRARFAGTRVAVLHSELPDAERAAQWLAAVEGRARLVVGTRLAVLTPLPALAAIVVDEEHDPSFKQQEGVRYSARDLAIALASRLAIPVVLGSATPSLESWLAARQGRYRLHALPERAHAGVWPTLRRIDPRRKALVHGLAPETRAAIEGALARGEQALVFMNRRGYAPVLGCDACGWLSGCANCAAWRVLHRQPSGIGEAGAGGGGGGGGGAGAPSSTGRVRYTLQCHHCGAQGPVPRACPECGNIDLQPLGRGTQRLEDGLRELFPQARIARLDRDIARQRGAARGVIEAAHRGEVDILVGTQMLAKGHDFQRLSCVVVVDADGGLFSADFRAPERLFATLMQVAGRAGRAGLASEVLVQTRYAHHPLFDALARRDFAGFADAQLAERRAAGLPPFVHQALLRVEASRLDAALDFLGRARELAPAGEVTLFDPVPMPMARLAGRERAQLLLEAPTRRPLHALLRAWLPAVSGLRGAVRWQIEIDPLEI